VAYPGREPIPISATKPLVLRYRLVLHKNADLNQLAGEYGGMRLEDIRQGHRRSKRPMSYKEVADGKGDRSNTSALPTLVRGLG